MAGRDLVDPSEQIEAVGALVREVLGDDAIGAYLHGSTATGRLRPHSDIDVLVVSRRPTSAEDRQRLIARLLGMSGPGDPSGRARSIELTIVVLTEVRPWRYPPALDFLYGDWLRAEFRRGDLQPWASPSPDLAPVLTMVLQADRAVFGPAPAAVLDPVPRADLDHAIVAGIPGLVADLDTDTANVVLTFARIWMTLATGRIVSKDAAADWCLARLPDDLHPVLARARAVYLGDAADRWDDLRPLIGPLVERILAEIQAVRPARAGRPRS